MSKSMQSYAKRIYKNAKAHGFWDKKRNFGEMMALIHSEVSEALVAHREGRAPIEIVDGKPEGAAVEIVDAIIRCLDTLIDVLKDTDYTVDDVMELKMAYNEGHCEYRHGKAY